VTNIRHQNQSITTVTRLSNRAILFAERAQNYVRCAIIPASPTSLV